MTPKQAVLTYGDFLPLTDEQRTLARELVQGNGAGHLDFGSDENSRNEDLFLLGVLAAFDRLKTPNN